MIHEFFYPLHFCIFTHFIFFPIFIFLMGRSFPAGLALYWAIGNIFMIFQSFYMKKVRQKEQIRDEIIKEEKENRKKAREEAKKSAKNK